MYKPVRFTGVQARAIYRGFIEASREHGYVFRALAILPDHTHLILMRHARHVDRIAAHLKAKATMQMNGERIHPLAAHPRADGTLPSPWSRSHWCPFVHDPEHLATAIRYVEQNALKAGLPAQRWRLQT